MLIVDQHVHSNISHDGKSSISEHIDYAKENHFDEITFTEHYDDYKGVDTNLETLDIKEYKKEYLKHKDDKLLKTNFGIEIGLRPESYKKIRNMVKNNDFDFIIGSSHITCGKDISTDNSFFEKLTPHQAVIAYLNEVLQNINIYKNEFDVYGHLDYIIRYVIKYYGNVMTRLNYIEFKELLDEILLSIIKNDKGIEINTSGIRYGLGTPHPNIEIVKRYKELGGKIITIGSDAHEKKDLASNFDVAYDMLDEAGFESIAVYHNREPEFIKIKKRTI
jgi:histidinol-phosphatase (PHP family)